MPEAMSLDDLQAQLRAALDQQFAALKTQYEHGIAEARTQAAEDAERDLQAKLVAARDEWETQLEGLIAAARAEAEQTAAQAAEAEKQALEQEKQALLQEKQRLLQETQTLQQDKQTLEDDKRGLEQAAAVARRTAELEVESERRRAQKDLERAQKDLEAERERAKGDLDAERQRVRSEFDTVRSRLEGELSAAREAALAATTAAAASRAVAHAAAPSSATFERAVIAMRALDDARTITQALESVLQTSAGMAGRAALFLINGDRLKPWKSAGIPDIDVQTVESSIAAKDLLARAIQSGTLTMASAAVPAPPFARLSGERAGLAVPLMVVGRPVAVLYADQGIGDTKPGPGWTEAIDLLARHASATIALRTAARTLDMLRGEPDGGAGNGDAPSEEGARRYARLLVSEIKLYNEAAVRAEREHRDLRQRLRAEIERAERLYEERIPPAVGARQTYFQQELVQTLADGDATLLGN